MAVGGKRTDAECRRFVHRCAANAAADIREFLYLIRIQGIVIDAEVVNASVEVRVGGKLAVSDVVQQWLDVGGAERDVG